MCEREHGHIFRAHSPSIYPSTMPSQAYVAPALSLPVVGRTSQPFRWTRSTLALAFVLTGLSWVRVSGTVRTNSVEFRLQESQPSGTYVGDIAKASGLASSYPKEILDTMRYKFYNPNNLQTASLFSINSDNGVMYTSAMIDREAVCRYQETCVIAFEVTATSTTAHIFDIIEVRVDVVDINDNPPRFPNEEVTLYIPEDAPPKSEYKIDGAMDADKGEGHSVERYEMKSSDDTFFLNVERNLDGSWGLKIITNKNLDREMLSAYDLLIYARDGGPTPQTGTLTVHIKVTDTNDNAPEFTEKIYNVEAREDAPVGSSVGQVIATDRDTGQNAQINFQFSTNKNTKAGDLVYIDNQSGEIKVKSPLEYNSNEIYELIVVASDRGNPPRTSQALVILSIKDVGNTPPRVSINPVTDKAGSTLTLSEGVAIGHVVAHVATVDRDAGMNGVVTCHSLNPHYSVETFEKTGRGFLVRVAKELDREAQQEHNVTVQCQDNGQPPLRASDHFLIRLTDENDNSPQFSQTMFRANLTENNKIGDFILRVQARDRDTGLNAKINYYISLEEGEDALVSIDDSTGEITTASVFDREIVTQVRFTVTAVDEGMPPRTGSASVVVAIVDVNDNQPIFSPEREFEVPEKMQPGIRVGRLKADDEDDGDNARISFLDMTRDSPHYVPAPFVVMADGTIVTDRMLQKTERDNYVMLVMARDSGHPPLNTTEQITIRVIDSNDNPPVVLFPTMGNNTVTLRSDMKPGETVAEILAKDDDEGMNSRLTYFIVGGNENRLFDIPYKDSGRVILTVPLAGTYKTSYELTIEVQDQGLPQLTTTCLLVLRVDFVAGSGPGYHSGHGGGGGGGGGIGGQRGFHNGTGGSAASLFGDEDMKYVIIAGVVGGVTVIVSIIIVTVIVRLRRPVHERRRGANGVIGGVQEQGDGRHFEKQLWHSVPNDDLSPLGDDHEKNSLHLRAHPGDIILAEKLGSGGPLSGGKGQNGGLLSALGGSVDGGGGGDVTDAYIKKHGGEQYAGQQHLYTFRKGPGRASNEDFQSDTSGETTASDSGRGGSEEDIQLPPLPEMTVDTSRLVFANSGSDVPTKERRFLYTNSPPPEGEQIAFETFSSRAAPTYVNAPGPRDPSLPPSNRDVHTLSYSRTPDRRPGGGGGTGSEGVRRYHHTQPRNFSPGGGGVSGGTSGGYANVRETQLGAAAGKRVTFKHDMAPRLLNDKLALGSPGGGSGDVSSFREPADQRSPGFLPSLQRAQQLQQQQLQQQQQHDDDDNTTTSGSYTLNVEDDIDDLPPPLAYSLA